MIAVDTNIIVRFLTRDDPAQAVVARGRLESGAVFLPRTVVLETEWVLRTGYRFDRGAIAAGLTKLMGLPGIVVEDASAVARALAWFARGLDFADALHLASSAQAGAFATFDVTLQRRARTIPDAVPVLAP